MSKSMSTSTLTRNPTRVGVIAVVIIAIAGMLAYVRGGPGDGERQAGVTAAGPAQNSNTSASSTPVGSPPVSSPT
jgi:hypothetical protein